MISRLFEINLNHPAHYLSIGPFSVSIGNLSIIVAMMVIFVVALFAPFPDHEHSDQTKQSSSLKGDRS